MPTKSDVAASARALMRRAFKGALATILVQNGTLRVGDDFISGKFSGRVRAMFDERGQTVPAAGPSVPVQILGFEGVPEAGDRWR